MVIRDTYNWKVTIRNREQAIIVTGTTAIKAVGYRKKHRPFIFVLVSTKFFVIYVTPTQFDEFDILIFCFSLYVY